MIVDTSKRTYGSFLILWTGLFSPIVFAASSSANDQSINWNGFYVGINAGYTFPYNKNVHTNTYVISATTAGIGAPEGAAASAASGAGSFSLNNDGFIGGGQIGYNRSIRENFLVGLESDIQDIAGANRSIRSSANVVVANSPANSIASNFAISKNIDYLGTLRGRLGYLFTPSLLLSGTGGLAYGGVNSKTIISQNLIGPSESIATNWGTTGNYSTTRVGWTAGSNIEWIFHPNWTAKIEYLYYDLGKITYNDGRLVDTVTTAFDGAPVGSTFAAVGINTTTHFNGQLVRVGINYHFD